MYERIVPRAGEFLQGRKTGVNVVVNVVVAALWRAVVDSRYSA
jgi:hypothetical protein